MKETDYDKKVNYAEVEAKLQAQSATRPSVGVMGLSGEAMRESFISRVRSRANAAQNEARRVDLLNELQYLLDKNPEVSRILDLIEQTGTR